MNHLTIAAIFLAAAIGLTWMHLARLRSIKRDADDAKRRLLSKGRPPAPPPPPWATRRRSA